MPIISYRLISLLNAACICDKIFHIHSKKRGTDLKTGLVLEGGGVRGIYTAGVLDVFLDNGIVFDGVIGVSAGAIHGGAFLSGQRGRSIRYYKKYSGDPRFMSMRSLLTTGNYVNTDFCYHELPEQLDVYDNDAFQSCGVPFYAVCTNVETGKPEYLRVTDMNRQIDVIRASASLPYFSQIVEINGRYYLDGGCTDSIPLEAFRSMGYEKNVVILTRPSDYRKKEELRAMPGLFYRNYPAFAEALRCRHSAYNRQAAAVKLLERSGQAFVIRPETDLEIGRLESDPKKVQQVYDRGVEDAKKQLDALLNWMQK